MMLEIAVDKRNSFSLNFCQAKLVQPSHLTSNKPYNSIVDNLYISIMDKPHNYIIMCNFTMRNSQKPGEETNKWCRVAKLSLHAFR